MFGKKYHLIHVECISTTSGCTSLVRHKVVKYFSYIILDFKYYLIVSVLKRKKKLNYTCHWVMSKLLFKMLIYLFTSDPSYH